MRLIEVQDEKTRRAFHEVPRGIYAEDPTWIPHLKQDVDKVFDPHGNRLFKKGGKAKRWLAQDEINREINMEYGKYLYIFELFSTRQDFLR